MLILFDIDATLITTAQTGIRAMGQAGRSLHGGHFDERAVEYAGRLDPLIIEDLLRAHGILISEDAVDAFRCAYGTYLEAFLAAEDLARPCPGVMTLLDRLEKADGLTLGLLTGNFPETGAIKLRAAGIEPDRFDVQVWGCDSPHVPPARDHLPAVGMARYEALHGASIDGSRVTIIGDTPHDVACAKAHGCRSLGVTTGQFSVQDMERAGADRVVVDLSDVDEVERWLLADPVTLSEPF